MPNVTDALYPQPAAPHTWRERLDLDSLEQRYGLPAGLLTAVLRAESAGDPAATSRAGAQGLFQLMPRTAQSYQAAAYHPEDAAEAAAQELGTLYKKYDGHLPATLAAWNWGQGNLDKQGLANAPRETRGFIQRVLGTRSAEASEPRTITEALSRGKGRNLTDDLFGASPPRGSNADTPKGRNLTDDLFGESTNAPGRSETLSPAPQGVAAPERPGVTQPATLPSDLVLDIEKPSVVPNPEPGKPAAVVPGIEFEGNALDDRSSASGAIATAPLTPEEQARQDALIREAGRSLRKQAAATVINMVGGAAGGTVGALTTPVLGPAGVPLGIAAGSLWSRQLNKKWEFEEPGLVGDIASVAIPLLPLAYQGGKALVAATRAGRALSRAEQETAAQALDYLTTYRQKEAANLEQAVAARAQGQQAQQAWLGAREAEKIRFAEDVTRVTGEHQQALARWQQAQDLKLQRHAARVAKAQQEAEQGTAASLQAYKEAIHDFETATKAHQDAITRVQQLPGQYLPNVPERTLDDVWNDMRILDRGGAEADALVKRLGTEDIFDAAAKLQDEGSQLAQRTGTAGMFAPTGDEAIAPSYQPPRLPGMKDTRIELQPWIRQQGGIKLNDEELRGEFAGLISRKETGTTGLLNNRTGKTAQQIAEAAQEQGYIATADKDSLLEALRESVTEGKPRYVLGDIGPQPTPPPLPGTMPTTSLSSSVRNPVHGPGSASQVLYSRLERVAGSSPVDLSSVGEAAAALKAELGFGVPSLQPSRIERVLDDLVNMGPNGSIKQVQEALKDLGPLAQNTHSKVRGASKQLMSQLHTAMEQSALDVPETEYAHKLLRAANQAWRQEEAVNDLRRVLTPGGTVLKKVGGQWALNPDQLSNQVERLIARDPFFAGSFSPEELARLRADIASFAQTPALPKKAPVLPGAIQPKPVPEPRLTEPPRLRLPQRRVSDTEIPDISTQPYTPLPYEPPAPVEPSVSFPTAGRLLADIGAGSALRYGVGVPGMQIAVPVADVAEALLSKALLSPTLRPLVKQALQPNGTLDPRLWGVLTAALRAPMTPQPETQRK